MESVPNRLERGLLTVRPMQIAARSRSAIGRRVAASVLLQASVIQRIQTVAVAERPISVLTTDAGPMAFAGRKRLLSTEDLVLPLTEDLVLPLTGEPAASRAEIVPQVSTVTHEMEVVGLSSILHAVKTTTVVRHKMSVAFGMQIES